MRYYNLVWLLLGCYAGKLVTALVREFLEFFELEYTCSVFDPETNAVSHTKSVSLLMVALMWLFVCLLFYSVGDLPRKR